MIIEMIKIVTEVGSMCVKSGLYSIFYFTSNTKKLCKPASPSLGL